MRNVGNFAKKVRNTTAIDVNAFTFSWVALAVVLYKMEVTLFDSVVVMISLSLSREMKIGF